MNIKEIMKAWTPAFSEAAQREGWDLFTCTKGSPVQVQTIADLDDQPEDAAHLDTDEEAMMMMVRTGTGDHHREARRIIYDNFPEEWALLDKAASSIPKAPHDSFIARVVRVCRDRTGRRA